MYSAYASWILFVSVWSLSIAQTRVRQMQEVERVTRILSLYKPGNAIEVCFSAIQCKKSRYTSRYHKETRKCYRIPSKGPCTGGMRFLSKLDADDLYGSCQCTESKRLSAYFPLHNKCYSVYQQAYCQPGKILMPLKMGSFQVECKTNPCHAPLNTEDVLQFKGRCVKYKSKCGNGMYDGKLRNKFIHIANDGSTVICTFNENLHRASAAVSSTCPRGSFRVLASLPCNSMTFNVDEWK